MARPASQAAPPPMHTLTSTNTPSDCSSVTSPSNTGGIRSAPAFEVGRPYFLLCKQLATATAERDQAVDHDIAAMRQIERMERILLHEKDGQLLFSVELANGAENLARNERRQAKRRLVQQKQTGSSHQRAR